MSLVLIPGLGADAAFYRPQRNYFGDRLVVPPWIAITHRDETINEYACRLAETIRSMPGLRRPFWIGGISLGGMIAARIAECCNEDVAGLFMLGACTRRQQIMPALLAVETPARYIPNGLLKGCLNRMVPASMAWAEGLSPEARQILEETAYRSDTRLLKWGARAIRRWEGADPRCQTFHAHGRRDRVIPLKTVPVRVGIDLIIPDGRHLITLSHPDAVNRWMAATMERNGG